MADNINTLETLTAENKTFYEKALLKRLTPELCYVKYGQKKKAPKKNGDKVSFRRFNSLKPATTPLTEGVTPTGSTLDITKVDAIVEQYGDYVTISDKLDFVGIDPVLTETSEVLGESAGLTVDTVVRDKVVSGTNVQYAGGKVGRDNLTAADKVTATEIRKAVRTLRKSDAKPVEGEYFIGLIDSEVAYDLMEDPLWQDISKYSGGAAIMDGEVGKLAGVRFVETNNNAVVDNSAKSLKVHLTMIIGKNAYGVVDIDGSSKPKMIVKPHGSGEDPLNQRATVGWKALFTGVRLDEMSMLRLESAASE